MATFKKQFQDPLKTCPYNPNHKVASRRFALHISDCAKRYPDWEQCPFNSLHRMPKMYLEQHMISCPDNKRVIREIYERQQSTERRSSNSDLLPQPSTSRDGSQRDEWDDPTVTNAKPIAFVALKEPEKLNVEEIVSRTPPGQQIDSLIRQRLSKAQRKELDRLLLQRQIEQTANKRRNEESALNSSQSGHDSRISRASSTCDRSERLLGTSYLEDGEVLDDVASYHSTIIDDPPTPHTPLSLNSGQQSDIERSHDRGFLASNLSLSSVQSPAPQASYPIASRINSTDSNRSVVSSLSLRSGGSHERTFIGIGRGSGRISLSSENFQRLSPHVIKANLSTSLPLRPSITVTIPSNESSSRLASIDERVASRTSFENESFGSCVASNEPPSSLPGISVIKPEPCSPLRQTNPKGTEKIPFLNGDSDTDSNHSVEECLSPSRGIKRERSPSSEEAVSQSKIPLIDE